MYQFSWYDLLISFQKCNLNEIKLKEQIKNGIKCLDFSQEALTYLNHLTSIQVLEHGIIAT